MALRDMNGREIGIGDTVARKNDMADAFSIEMRYGAPCMVKDDLFAAEITDGLAEMIRTEFVIVRKAKRAEGGKKDVGSD